MAGHKSISLVLGSGGARGHAHIGVIRAIEEHNLEIRNIAGTSMGAVIGGVFAAGKLDTYEDWAGQLTRQDVVKLLDLSFTRTSLFKGERIIDVLKELIGDYQIEDLDIGFTAVATAISEQREIWLNNGPLFHAMRASSAVPGVFRPVEHEGRMLVDGGLVNPIPIAPTLNDTNDLTIAVNLNAMPDYPAQEADDVLSAERKGSADHRNTIQKFVANLLGTDNSNQPAPDVVELLTKSIDVMQGGIARLKLAAYAPDIVIDISREACSFYEFDCASKMIDLGYEAATESLAHIDSKD